MKRHVIGASLVIASIFLGSLFFPLGRDWFVAYVIFGGAIFMAVLAWLDGCTCRCDPGRSSPASAKKAGLTLIGVLCIVTLTIILVLVIMPKYGSGRGTARLTAAVTQIAEFRTQLDAFRDDTGFYPTSLQGLIREPAGTTNWHGPYAQDIPKDPWGREYVYEIPGKHTFAGYPYDLFSPGPTPGTNLIANWAFPNLKP